MVSKNLYKSTLITGLDLALHGLRAVGRDGDLGAALLQVVTDQTLVVRCVLRNEHSYPLQGSVGRRWGGRTRPRGPFPIDV